MEQIQAECDKLNILLAQRENEFRQLHMLHEESALIVENLKQERNNFLAVIQTLENDNCQLNEDVNLLKNLIYRLNIEIEKYQDKLRNLGHTTENQTTVSIIDKVEVESDNKNVLRAWGSVHFHALGPLLDAYQENINEKDELVKKYRKVLDDFTGRIKEIVSENESLYIEIEGLKEKVYTVINYHTVKCFAV